MSTIEQLCPPLVQDGDFAGNQPVRWDGGGGGHGLREISVLRNRCRTKREHRKRLLFENGQNQVRIPDMARVLCARSDHALHNSVRACNSSFSLESVQEHSVSKQDRWPTIPGFGVTVYDRRGESRTLPGIVDLLHRKPCVSVPYISHRCPFHPDLQARFADSWPCFLGENKLETDSRSHRCLLRVLARSLEHLFPL